MKKRTAPKGPIGLELNREVLKTIMGGEVKGPPPTDGGGSNGTGNSGTSTTSGSNGQRTRH